jgi:hypothetical protein
MPKLSVSHEVLTNKIHTWTNFRSGHLNTMLKSLSTYEKTSSPETILALLKTNARNWRRNQPKEFNNRDKISGGLCTKLLVELGLQPAMNESPEPNCRAYEVVNDPTNVGALDATNGAFTAYDMSLLDLIRQRYEQGAQIGVIIIDVQTGKDTALDDASLIGNGLHVKYDSQSVLHNQADVVGLARDLKIPIFNVTASGTGNMQTVAALRNKFPQNGEGVHDFNKTNNNVVGEFDANNKPKFLKLVHEHLGNEKPTYLAIMGFNANQCVQGSVFGNRGGADYSNMYGDFKGTPKTKGLLEYGFTIMTCRNVLASSCAPLEAAWGPMRAT